MARAQVGSDVHFRGRKRGRPRKSKKNKYGLRRRGRKS
mgnify:CR=1 FL=1|jgi:hypothetical protein